MNSKDSEISETSSPNLVITRDGSHTVYSQRFDQHYHNPNGAVAESRYVFFEKSGLLEALQEKSKLTILEIGFGTGLNLMLLLDYCLKLDVDTKINYYSVEGFPLNLQTADSFNFGNHLEHPHVADKVAGLFGKLHTGNNYFQLTEQISLHLFNGMYSDYNVDYVGANFIFHDAFSPGANPELWTGKVFQKLRVQSSDDVILTTYCAASKARAAMAWAGWKVARAKGALGKREMTLAALDPTQLGDLKRVNEKRLAHRYETDDF